jgi:predicted nucleic acid-binding protein
VRFFQGFEISKKACYARKVVEEIYRYLTILTVSDEIIDKALALSMEDFEDAVQAAAAKNFDINIIITRDKMGFYGFGLLFR